MSTQANIIKAFSLGKFPGSAYQKPEHIITVISNVFISGDLVYKIYKNDNKTFNKGFYDISNRQNRFGFTRNDFSWNHNLSAAIYLELRGIILKNQSIIFTEPTDRADEFCIVMKKIDMQNALTSHLINRRLDLNDFYQIGHQFGERIIHLPEMSDAKINLYQDFIIRIRDIDKFMDWVNESIPNKEASGYVEFMYNFLGKHKSRLEKAKNLIGAGIDIHSENAVFINGKLYLIDTYPPKDNWHWGHKHIGIYRLATDVYALRGEKEFRKVLKGYEDFSKEKLDQSYEKFFILYAATIMCAYYYQLVKHDLSRVKVVKKYHAFLRLYFQNH